MISEAMGQGPRGDSNHIRKALHRRGVRVALGSSRSRPGDKITQKDTKALRGSTGAVTGEGDREMGKGRSRS